MCGYVHLFWQWLQLHIICSLINWLVQYVKQHRGRTHVFHCGPSVKWPLAHHNPEILRLNGVIRDVVLVGLDRWLHIPSDIFLISKRVKYVGIDIKMRKCAICVIEDKKKNWRRHTTTKRTCHYMCKHVHQSVARKAVCKSTGNTWIKSRGNWKRYHRDPCLPTLNLKAIIGM